MTEPLPPRPFAAWPWLKPTAEERLALDVASIRGLIRQMSRIVPPGDDGLLVSVEVYQRLLSFVPAPSAEEVLGAPDLDDLMSRPICSAVETLRQAGLRIDCGVNGLRDAQAYGSRLAPPWSALTVIIVRDGRVFGRTEIKP